MPPRARVQGTFHQMHTSSLLSLSDFFYVFLLLRNFHTVQFFYWCSRFSAPRNYAFLSFRREKAKTFLTIKTYLAAYSLKLILLLYGVFVILSGLVLFTLEKGSKSPEFDYVQNSFWALAVLQTTVGYGDVVSTTYLGSCLVALITSSTSGRLALSRAECGLYSELAYMRYIRKYRKPAVVLIQRWWKLMDMRKRRILNGQLLVFTHRCGLTVGC